MTTKAKLGVCMAVLCAALVTFLVFRNSTAKPAATVGTGADHAAVSPASALGNPTVPASETVAPKGPKDYRSRIEGGKKMETAHEAIVAMNELLQIWSPVGKTPSEVIEILGEPSERTDKDLYYRMITHFGGCLWRLKLESGVVVDVSKMVGA